MSRRGNCHDNAVAESIFQRLKRERIKKKIYGMREEARSDIFDYIEMFYNSKRRHGSSDQMPPTEHENQYYQKLRSVQIIRGDSLTSATLQIDNGWMLKAYTRNGSNLKIFQRVGGFTDQPFTRRVKGTVNTFRFNGIPANIGGGHDHRWGIVRNSGASGDVQRIYGC